MRALLVIVAGTLIAACNAEQEKSLPATVEASFDGANYSTDASKIAHGKRIAAMFSCSGCHGADYAGQNFGAMIPIVDGLWASNISLAIPAMSDQQLENLLREGVHPSREIYVMPSKQTQFLSAKDMSALIAFLRTIPPTGKPTPLPPKGFEAAVTSRLPDDYWRTLKDGEKKGYHNAAEEVDYFRANRLPALGQKLERGRMIASTVCSSCHGAQLDGIGEPAGNIQGSLAYDDSAFDQLLSNSVDRHGKEVKVEWGFGHEIYPLTANERGDAIAYVRALARSRSGKSK